MENCKYKNDTPTAVFGSEEMLKQAPIDVIPQQGTRPEIAYQMVKDETFAQTQPRTVPPSSRIPPWRPFGLPASIRGRALRICVRHSDGIRCDIDVPTGQALWIYHETAREKFRAGRACRCRSYRTASSGIYRARPVCSAHIRCGRALSYLADFAVAEHVPCIGFYCFAVDFYHDSSAEGMFFAVPFSPLA